MKRSIIYSWLLVLPCLWILAGCADEELMEKTRVGEDEVWVDLSFGSSNNHKINITTRATYDLKYESMVQNVYVFIFVNNERVYGQYFNDNNLRDYLDTKEEIWCVTQSDNADPTAGWIRMKAPIVQGAEIFMIANLDLNFLSLSEERLNMVRSKEDLNNVIVSLNQDIVERNAGLFMMTGSSTGVNIQKSNDDYAAIIIPNNRITLSRMDAKVEVNIKVDPSGTLGLDGQRYVVKEFVPDSWEVYNLPDNCYLVEHTTGDSEKEDKSEGYFNLPARKFETYSDEKGNGFSFYMMENRESGSMVQSTGNNYHLRDLRAKNADGTYTSSGNSWAYAPEFGTYLVLKGTLNMEVNPNSTAPQQLTADVVYHIHLGDFKTDKDNYDINRNTHYTYTVKIKGINSIETEVQTSNANLAQIDEPQPGASGNIYKTVEDTYIFDAHYGQRVYTLHVSDIVEAAKASTLSWYVKTPFGREGSPLIDTNSGQPIYEGLDYKWVEFMLNKKKHVGDTYTYSDNNQWYPGIGDDDLMDVVQFTNLLKKEAPNYREGVPNDVFDKNGNLKVTVFVNEYYYEEHPTEPGNNPKDLWKQFVNKPHRIMHILSNPLFSKDGDSSVTNSSITIRQRAIATPYTTEKVGLEAAWGCETEDEVYDSYWWFFPGESKQNAYPNPPSGNTSRLNGLYNTGILWGIFSGSNFVNNMRWDTFLNYERENDHPSHWMKDDYKSLLYATMMRNRDNNGNKIIDANEIRWYIASIEQLYGLFIGDMGLPSESQLYRKEKMVRGTYTTTDGAYPHGINIFREHIICSTRGGRFPIMLWAEEGASVSDYRTELTWNNQNDLGVYSVRCIRNLGMSDSEDFLALTNSEYELPERLIFVEKSGSGKNTSYRFDLSNVNEGSLRSFYTTEYLLPGDESDIVSRPYKCFVTGNLIEYAGYTKLKDDLENFKFNSGQVGFRAPNVREGALMSLYCTGESGWWPNNNNNVMVSSFYSMGKYGKYNVPATYIDPDYNTKYTWHLNEDFTSLNAGSSYIRLVKDEKP